MRRVLALSAALLLAGCATTPQPQTPAPQPVQPVQPVQQRNDLIGMSAAELIRTFGTPALQVREGPGLKLQFRGGACVLDAFLYPSSGGERVTYVDTRLPNGASANAQSCYDALKRG